MFIALTPVRLKIYQLSVNASAWFYMYVVFRVKIYSVDGKPSWSGYQTLSLSRRTKRLAS
jgi:hypothetical protein